MPYYGMPNFDQLLVMLVSPDNIWSVILRAAIWFVIALVIIVSTDNPNPDKAFKDLKSNLGFFLMFLVISSVLIFLLFGFAGA